MRRQPMTSDYGLSPFRHQAIIWTNAGQAFSAPGHYLNQCWTIVNYTFETNFSEILIEI